MRDGEYGDDVVEREVEADAGAVAVANAGDLGDTALLQRREDLTRPGLCVVGPVLDEPGTEVKLDARVERPGRACLLEEVGHDDLVAVEGKVICEKLIGSDRMRIADPMGEASVRTWWLGSSLPKTSVM